MTLPIGKRNRHQNIPKKRGHEGMVVWFTQVNSTQYIKDKEDNPLIDET
jgi:hypothetical protein